MVSHACLLLLRCFPAVAVAVAAAVASLLGRGKQIYFSWLLLLWLSVACCCYRCSCRSDRTRLRNPAKQASYEIVLKRRRLLHTCSGNALLRHLRIVVGCNNGAATNDVIQKASSSMRVSKGNCSGRNGYKKKLCNEHVCLHAVISFSRLLSSLLLVDSVAIVLVAVACCRCDFRCSFCRCCCCYCCHSKLVRSTSLVLLCC